MDMTTNWITAGQPIDVVYANNDEMALGAIQASEVRRRFDGRCDRHRHRRDTGWLWPPWRPVTWMPRSSRTPRLNLQAPSMRRSRWWAENLSKNRSWLPFELVTPEEHERLRQAQLIAMTGTYAYVRQSIPKGTTMDGIVIVGAGRIGHQSGFCAFGRPAIRVRSRWLALNPTCLTNAHRCQSTENGAVTLKALCSP